MNGQRIIDGLKEAISGDFGRVTINGHVWQRVTLGTEDGVPRGGSLSKDQLDQWTQFARRDDWHQTFVGSDIRQMLGEIERLTKERDALAFQLQELGQQP